MCIRDRYRAALGKVDFSVFLAGKTGVFKTALAALCQQHFGSAMDASSLPTNFASTGNALQWLASVSYTHLDVYKRQRRG